MSEPRKALRRIACILRNEPHPIHTITADIGSEFYEAMCLPPILRSRHLSHFIPKIIPFGSRKFWVRGHISGQKMKILHF